MLWIKMFRDLKQNIVQFLTIFIMAFICLFVVAGLSVCEYDSLDKYYRETNFRDLEIQGSFFSSDSINSLELIDDIRHVDALYNTNGKLHLDEDIKMLVSYISSNDVSKLYLVEGTPYEPGMRGVWLDDSMCQAQGVHVGDVISMTVDGADIVEEVMGRVCTPSYLYYMVDSSYVDPVYGEYGFAIMDNSEYAGVTIPYNQLLIDIKGVDNQVFLTDKEDRIVEKVKKNIAKVLDDERLIYLTKHQDTGLKFYRDTNDSIFAMLYVFPALFGMIALLGIMTTMTRLVSRQRTTIGALKALGFTSKTITFHYISYSVVIVLIGCILGSIAGYQVLGDAMKENEVLYFLNPYMKKPVSILIPIVTLILIVISILVGYFSNHKILSLSASQILQPEAPKKTKQSWYEGFVVWKKLKFSLRWNVRDVTINVFRTIMSIVGVLLCSALIFSAVGLLECLMYQVDWQYGELIKANNRITFTQGTAYSTVYEYANEYQGQMVQRNSILLEGYENKILTMTVVDRGHNFFLHNEDGDYIKLPDSGIGMSYKFAVNSGKKIGDIVSWKIQGSKEIYTDRVAYIYREPMFQGIMMSRDYFEDIHGQFEPLEVYTNLSVSKDIESRNEIEGVNTVDRLRQGVEAMAASNYFIVEIMIAVAIILGVSILYNLGSMSYNEKVKDMATLKVLGFRTKELKTILMQQNLLITGIGAILGIPFGFQILGLLTTILGENVDCMVSIDILPYLIEFVVTFLMSILINQLIISKLEDIDMVEALKGV